MALIIRDYFLLFIFYSIFGWASEVIYAFIMKRKITNRGFMIGPYCPIYGVGSLLIIILLSQYKVHPIGLCVLAMVICSVLEYVTGYVLEKLFKARWWDYSNTRFNINGRVCLDTLIPFGILACLIMYVINPAVLHILNKVPNKALNIISVIIAIIFVFDFVASFNIVNNFKQTIKKVSLEDKTDDINNYIKSLFTEKSFLYRRLIQAFPKIKAITKRKKD